MAGVPIPPMPSMSTEMKILGGRWATVVAGRSVVRRSVVERSRRMWAGNGRQETGDGRSDGELARLQLGRQPILAPGTTRAHVSRTGAQATTQSNLFVRHMASRAVLVLLHALLVVASGCAAPTT